MGKIKEIWGWYIKCFRKYADFEGRAGRNEYLIFNYVHSLVFFLAIIFNVFLSETSNFYWISSLILILYFFITLIPTLAIHVRRLHDIGYSGYYVLLLLIPLIGWLWLSVKLHSESILIANRYGQNSDD